MKFRQLYLFALFLLLGASLSQAKEPEHPRTGPAFTDEQLADQVIVKRTAYGVPHIFADNIKAAGYGLAYVQMEDYGNRVVRDLIRSRGEWMKYHDIDMRSRDRAVDAEVAMKIQYEKAVATWPRLNAEAQDIIEGFTLGVNRYIELHPDEFEDWVQPFFTVYDVHSAGLESVSLSGANQFLRKLRQEEASAKNGGMSAVQDEVEGTDLAATTFWERRALAYVAPPVDLGSNAWAFAPSRTKSGKAVLVRNPHLSWNAGYYEAHVKIPGVFDYYGDYRIGAPLITVGGFNEHLGWSTTNNDSFMDEIYALEADPEKPDHYLLDNQSFPLTKETKTVTFRNGKAYGNMDREVLSTPYGPVIHRGNGKIYILKSAAADAYRAAEQYLAMMKAKTLSEWKEAMRIRGIVTSNFTYADDAGNIFYVWNGAVPDLPVSWSGEGAAKSVTQSSEIWSKLVNWDELPQLENPKGGYLHNENDTFHFTNLNAVLAPEDFPDYYPEPTFRLRSQLSYELIGKEREKFSLEDIVKLKSSTKMLLADRVKGDLIEALTASHPEGTIQEALQLLKDWDNTVSAESKGGLLFQTWWDRYVYTAPTKGVSGTPQSVGFRAAAEELFTQPWSADRPAVTPYGIADPDRAVTAFKWAVNQVKNKYGSWDKAWGEVHRAIAVNKNEPANGCSGEYGCFRVFWFKDTEVEGENKLQVTGGDGWVIAIEFGKKPKAYSILAYGQSDNPDSPYYYDQLDMFVNKEMKPVYYQEREIKKQTLKEYRPGK